MGEQFIQGQYTRMRDENSANRRTKFYDGTYLHPENVELLVYYALVFNNPQLGSSDRAKVIQGMKGLPRNLKTYLHLLSLGGLMNSAFEKGERSSPLAVLKVFDAAFQRRTRNASLPSLFDLSQEEHLHEWGDNFQAPNAYWKNPVNVENAVYHVLTENNAILVSTNRAEVISGIKKLPLNLKEYFISLGLSGLMSRGFEKGDQDSPLTVLKAFDRAYQRETRDVSLFDLSQAEHLHEWGDYLESGKKMKVHFVPQRNPHDIETAVYHELTERNPQLASHERAEVVLGLLNLRSHLTKYFSSIGLVWVIRNTLPHPSIAILEAFDRVYQRETRDTSLFDRTQKYHLAITSRNRLVGVAGV